MRNLSDQERELWSRITKDVAPLDRSPVSPLEPLPITRVSAPRSVPQGPVLDLHGLTLHDAFVQSKAHIENAYGRFRYVVIITGLSGQIHDEFPSWVTGHRLVRSINSLRGGGAWEIWLKKSST